MFGDILVKHDYEIAKRSHIKIGGVFETVYFPRSLSEIQEVIAELDRVEQDYIVIGNLSNVLFREGKIETIAISLKYLKSISIQENEVYVESGMLMPAFATYLSKRGYRGLEGIVGIPGTVGGGIFMNASSYGSCISDYISSVTVITSNNEVIELSKGDCEFEWRRSIFHTESYNKYIIIACKFIGIPKDDSPDEAIKLISKIRNERVTYQENKYPNLGSTFATLDIYNEIINDNIVDKLMSIFIRAVSKLSNDRHRTYVNLMRKYIIRSRQIPSEISDNISECTLNCFVNKGISFSELTYSIKEFKKLTSLKVNTEIEIIEDIK